MTLLQIDDSLSILSEFLDVPRDRTVTHYEQLLSDDGFLTSINETISDVPCFHGRQFAHVSELHLYRSLLYLFTRITKPEVFVETGVLNGFSSAFILLAMEHNRIGSLISIDLPSSDPNILRQGTGELPTGKRTGWLIPDRLRVRHDLRLGAAQTLLPAVFEEFDDVDVFLHDSDHGYTHMMFEMSLAWHYLREGGWIIADNIEQNHAFADFVRATGGRSLIVSSFLRPERTWQHGMTQKNNQSN